MARLGFAGLGDGVTRLEQIGDQLVGIAATWGWSFLMTGIILLAIKYTVGVRVKDENETVGLDISLHGESAYVDD